MQNPPKDLDLKKTVETVLEIHLPNLLDNFQTLRSKVNEKTKILAVVKAVAYGTDAMAVAKCLELAGVDYFAVAYVSEGVALRKAGITKPILVLHPQIGNLKKAIQYDLEPSMYSFRILRAFAALLEEKKIAQYPIHIKFNTGLNRLGFTVNDIELLLKEINTPFLTVVSIFSHLAASEDVKEKAFTQKQIEKFKAISKQFDDRPMRHLVNTSGILNFPEAHFDMVRTGIGLYGYGNDPVFDSLFKPVAQLKTVISQIHTLKKGESLGYNRAFVANKTTRTATLPLGHADGIGRHYGNEKGVVYVNSHPAKIIGNVCMDMLMIDVTDIDCHEGDEVVIFGEKHQSAEMFAKKAQTISYEILTAISHRIKRKFIVKP